MMGVDKILVGFVVFLLIVSAALCLVEPTIMTYGDAIWYSFSVVTTIGFGDYAAATLIGRTLTMILGLDGLIVVALIPGVLVGYYLDFVQKKADDTIGVFLEKLERLDELSKDELRQISKKVKEQRYQL